MNRTLLTLQVGRGLAALAVAVAHASQSSEAFFGHSSVNRLLEYGGLGVDFFFVLSGFIIMHVHMNDSRVVPYARKRLVRIFVPYLPVSLVSIAAYTLLPTLSASDREWSMLSSLLLIPDYNPPALNPAWTLIHEMLFYWFFVIYLVARRAFLPAVCVWLALICVNVWAKPALLPFWRTFLDPMNIEFIVGMGCAWAVTRLDPRHGLKLLFGGVVVATASFLLVLNHAPQYLFGVALAPLVVGFVLIEPRIRHRIPKLAILVGDASYSIYLIHNPAISILARTISGLAPLTATMVLSVLASAAGFVYYVVFERPALRAVRLLMPAAARPVSS
jgi:peptidoglycan/LPS O-acetylase OafA/YrhL